MVKIKLKRQPKYWNMNLMQTFSKPLWQCLTDNFMDQIKVVFCIVVNMSSVLVFLYNKHFVIISKRFVVKWLT